MAFRAGCDGPLESAGAEPLAVACVAPGASVDACAASSGAPAPAPSLVPPAAQPEHPDPGPHRAHVRASSAPPQTSQLHFSRPCWHLRSCSNGRAASASAAARAASAFASFRWSCSSPAIEAAVGLLAERCACLLGPRDTLRGRWWTESTGRVSLGLLNKEGAGQRGAESALRSASWRSKHGDEDTRISHTEAGRCLETQALR